MYAYYNQRHKMTVVVVFLKIKITQTHKVRD
jgi:hypothetical protein